MSSIILPHHLYGLAMCHIYVLPHYFYGHTLCPSYHVSMCHLEGFHLSPLSFFTYFWKSSEHNDFLIQIIFDIVEAMLEISHRALHNGNLFISIWDYWIFTHIGSPTGKNWDHQKVNYSDNRWSYYGPHFTYLDPPWFSSMHPLKAHLKIHHISLLWSPHLLIKNSIFLHLI